MAAQGNSVDEARAELAVTTQKGSAKRRSMRNKPGGGAKRLSTTKNLAGMRPKPKHFRREAK